MDAAARAETFRALVALHVAGARMGRHSDFAALVRLAGPRLPAHTRRLAVDAETARDIVQEAWAAIARGLPGLPADAREPGFYPLAFSLFRGPQGWVTRVLITVQTVMFLAAVRAGGQSYSATEVLAALKWGVSAATLAILATKSKMALMPQLQANRVILALRRRKLRLAQRQG